MQTEKGREVFGTEAKHSSRTYRFTKNLLGEDLRLAHPKEVVEEFLK